MSVGDRPHFQQAVYDEGHKDGRRAGFESGEQYGRGCQKLEDELKPVIGFALGILVSTIVVCVLNLLGMFP